MTRTWADTAKLLSTGGAERMTEFLSVAEEYINEGGVDPVAEFAYRAFILLPELEKSVLLEKLIRDSIKLRTLYARKKPRAMRR